jgi:copper transport protein
VAEGGPFLDRVPFGPGQVELSVEPGTRGTNELHVIAFDPDGRLMDVEELTVALTLPAEDLGPLEPELTEITRGHVTSYAQIPLAGRWTVEVTGRLSRFESLEATFEVDVGP